MVPATTKGAVKLQFDGEIVRGYAPQPPGEVPTLRWDIFLNEIFIFNYASKKLQNALRLDGSNFSTDCVDKNFVLNGKYQTLRLWHFPWRLLFLRQYLLEHAPADVLKVSAGSNARAVTYHALLGSRLSLRSRLQQSRGAGTYHKRNVWWFAWRKNFLSSHFVENSVPFKRSAFSEFSMLAFRQKIFLANHLSEALVRSCSSTESSFELTPSNCNLASSGRGTGGILSYRLVFFSW